MNCREFENMAADLARVESREMIDPSLRQRGEDHARNCEHCSEMLANQQALSYGLKALAAVDRDKSASLKTGDALLVAFRNQAAKASKTGAESNVVPFPDRRRYYIPLAAAAALLLTFGLILYRSTQPASPAGVDRTSSIEESIQTPSPVIAAADKTPENSPEPIKPPAIKKRAAGRSLSARQKEFVIRDSMTLYASDSEVTTDFLPTGFSANQQPLQSGQLIRVQMPRAALLKFGLPMNAERANTPVKADLLVGDDGLAHAIRFVR